MKPREPLVRRPVGLEADSETSPGTTSQRRVLGRQVRDLRTVAPAGHALRHHRCCQDARVLRDPAAAGHYGEAVIFAPPEAARLENEAKRDQSARAAYDHASRHLRWTNVADAVVA